MSHALGTTRASITLREVVPKGFAPRIITLSTPIFSTAEIDAERLKVTWEGDEEVEIDIDCVLTVNGQPLFRGLAAGAGLEPATSGVTTQRSTS